MFLAAGHHVRADVPEQLRATGRGDVVLADAFGPDPAFVVAAAQRGSGTSTVISSRAGPNDPDRRGARRR